MKNTPISPTDFWGWMKTLPEGIEIIIIIVALVIIICMAVGTTLLIHYFLKTRQFRLKYGKFEFDSNNKMSKEKAIQVSDKPEHHTCINKNDIMILLDKSYEVSNYEISLMKLETIREQMDYAEHTMTNLLSMLENEFIKELRHKIEGSLTQTDDYNSYKTVLELFRTRLLNSFRGFCRENHFVEMGREEFDRYSKIKSLSLLKEGTDYLNDLYFHEKNISRDQLYEINKPHIETFLSVIRGILNNSREVAIRNSDKLISKKLELAEFLASFVGKDNPLLHLWKKQHKLI